MYLKEVIVEGFKSIGIKKRIQFLNAINIIMGVNGSGKSNVFECIEWVLGGKSAKQLRADSMEDVIFDGGKSMNSSNFAEATLVFDNVDRDVDIDSDEVHITRRLTKGKGNAYFINHEPAKLKDIKKLFENKGIGKNNYAITGQSKITDFIMMNGEQTRHVIEEAAGISGVRIKKEEILQSIENYDRDIERIDAVIFEMERNLKPLKKQIKNAEIYKITKLELDQKKLFAFSKKLDECTEKINTIYEEKNNLLSEKESLLKVKEDIEIFLEKYTDIYNLKLEDLANLESNKEALDKELSEINKNTIMFENHKNNLTEKRNNLVSDVEKLESSTFGEDVESNDLFKNINDLDKEISSLTSSLESLSKDIEDEESKITSFKTDINLVKNKVNDIDTEIKVNETKFNTNQNSLSKLKEELVSSENNLSDIKKEISDINSNLESNNKTLELFTSNYNELIKIDKEVKSLENILNSTKRGNNRKNKILEIRELIKKVNGFNDVLFNIVSYDDEYINAIDSLFGGTLYNFVVDNTESANKCIDILKKNKIPPEKFIVLDKFNNKTKAIKSIEKAENVIDLLKYDEKYSDMVNDYFANNFISKNDKDAEFAWNKCSQKFRVATLDGTLYSANVIKGGFIQKNIKQAQTELDSLLLRKDSLLKIDNNVFQNSYEIKSKIDILKSNIDNMSKSLLNMESRLNKEESRFTDTKNNIENLEEFISKFNKIQEDLLNQKSNLEVKISNLETELSNMDSKLNNLKSIKEEKTLKLNTSKALLEENEKNYFIFKNNSKEKIESLKMDIDVLNGQLENATNKYEESLKEESILNEKISSIHSEILKNKQDIEDMIKDKDTQTSSLRTSIESISHIDNKIVKLDFEVEKINEKEDSYREHLAEIPDEVEFVEFEDNINNILKEVAVLEKKVKSLGFINFDALDEYEELNSRYTLLVNNKRDLEESKSKLLTTIQELQDSMLTKYVECFNVIKKDFSEIFKRLFAGGDGELIMENPDSPLSSDVIIKATPPGKKNKPLSLLSGGEKSLAAVSFIFALLKYNPSPVVIFDEIDAALDEINVSLIADYISENKNVQYIIVSHRKPMMKSADVIYTAMMTNGVTNLISTKFDGKTA